jgi:hypothetical protein
MIRNSPSNKRAANSKPITRNSKMKNVEVVSSVTGQFWHILVDGKIAEGFNKTGEGRAKKSQVEAIAEAIRKGQR